MKLLKRIQIWDLKREKKFYEKKAKFIGEVIKHIEKEE